MGGSHVFCVGLTFDARSGRAHVWLSARRTSALRTSENVPSPFFEMKRYSENSERGGERGGEGRVMAVSRFATSEELLDSAAREWGAGGREWGAGGKQPQGARAVAITVECSNASERCGFRVGPNVLCIHPVVTMQRRQKINKN